MVVISNGCVKQPYEINETQTSRLVQTLSSDDMRGRRAFTPEIDRAADVIASEFNEIGLDYFDGLESYRQEFSVREFHISEANANVDGKKLEDGTHFGFVRTGEINWRSGDVNTASIQSDDEFNQLFRRHSRSDEDLLVFVDRGHADIFNRYRAYFHDRHSRVMESGPTASVYFMLSDPSESFNLSIQAESNELSLSNVIGKIEGNRDDEVVLFSAHYDHIGIQNAVEGDSIANGANDNASGVTAVIELARYFESMDRPERTLLFVGFTAEEMGGYGSRYFSRQLNPDEIIAMFNIEMIGKPAVSGPNTAWITGYDRSTFGEILSESAEETKFEFYPDPYPNQNLFYRSDNATLARLGVPAHTISTTPIDVDPDYHQVSDEFETLHTSHMTNTIRAIAKAAHSIVSAEKTPTRVDTSTVQ